MIRRSMEGANCRAVSAAMEPPGLCETQIPASRGTCGWRSGVRRRALYTGRRGKGQAVCEIRGVSRPGVVDGGARVARQERMVDMARLYRAHRHTSARSAGGPRHRSHGAIVYRPSQSPSARRRMMRRERPAHRNQMSTKAGGLLHRHALPSREQVPAHLVEAAHLEAHVSEPSSFSSMLWVGMEAERRRHPAPPRHRSAAPF